MAAEKKAAKRAKADKRLKAERPGRARKKVVRARSIRSALVAGAMMLTAAVAGGGWWVWQSGVIPKAALNLKAAGVAWSARAGFEISDIFLTGRRQTTQEALRRALNLERGSPILAFDPDAARARLEALPWVKSASITRLLPDRVLVHVTERRELALWQNGGKFALIDEDGEVILRTGLKRFGDLPVVVGEDAPDHTKGLLEVLASEPGLMDMVKAAVRVGGRRWNVHLKNGIHVHLPEDGAADAWTRLAEYERSHRLLARDVEILDLRLPDRLIVRKSRPEGPTNGPVPDGRPATHGTPSVEKTRPKPGRET